MADAWYSSTGDNSTGTDWATALTSFAAALSAAGSGDTVFFDMANIASADAEVSGTTEWVIPDGVTVHIGTQNGASGITTGVMGTTYWLGNSTTGRTVRLRCSGVGRIIGGLTFRTGSFGALSFNWYQVGSLTADELYAWHSATSGDAYVTVGHNSAETYTNIGKLTLDNDDTSGAGSALTCVGIVDIGYLHVDVLDSLSTAALLVCSASCHTTIHGGDISSIGSGETLCSGSTNGVAEFFLENVVLPASFVMLTTQVNDSPAGGHITLRDCSSSGSAVPYAYANACGEIRIDTGIYLTAGIAQASAKVVLSSVCSQANPFYGPWWSEYKASGTVEPKYEVARDGSATAFTDLQFYMETLAKDVASSVVTTLHSTIGTGSNIPTGVGTGSWTSLSGTAWSGELTQGSIDLEAAGYVKSRIVGMAPSETLYVDIGAIG